MTEYYIFDYYETKLYCCRVGTYNPKTDSWEYSESREIFTGLPCVIKDDYISLFTNNYVIQNKGRQVSREEFIEEIGNRMNNTDKKTKDKVAKILIKKAISNKKR